MELLKTELKNKVLQSMMQIMDSNREALLAANKTDLDNFERDDQALYDRLVIDDSKIDGMIQSVREVMGQDDPVGRTISSREVNDGLKVVNKTAPFGTIMIIYESRPDVTIEAAVLAFKANNKILLKGGKEAFNSNVKLVEFWHQALKENGLEDSWIQYLRMNREETQAFLKNPGQQLDLIVPRGGERLIEFVKTHAKCAVLVSGRGNNFLYVDSEADWEMSLQVILNAKTQKISACNALDKILIDKSLSGFEEKVKILNSILKENGVTVLADKDIKNILPDTQPLEGTDVWYEEFLALKCVLGAVDSLDEALEMINTYSGGHSATIMTGNQDKATRFMEQVDSAAVYHNASTRFTDGGMMGVGAELAISTDKLHHRGPLGLHELVTNKYYVYGNGHVRK